MWLGSDDRVRGIGKSVFSLIFFEQGYLSYYSQHILKILSMHR